MTARTQEHRRRRWPDVKTRFRAFIDDEAGDVPGWVLVTLMTAGWWCSSGPSPVPL